MTVKQLRAVIAFDLPQDVTCTGRAFYVPSAYVRKEGIALYLFPVRRWDLLPDPVTDETAVEVWMNLKPRDFFRVEPNVLEGHGFRKVENDVYLRRRVPLAEVMSLCQFELGDLEPLVPYITPGDVLRVKMYDDCAGLPIILVTTGKGPSSAGSLGPDDVVDVRIFADSITPRRDQDFDLEMKQMGFKHSDDIGYIKRGTTVGELRRCFRLGLDAFVPSDLPGYDYGARVGSVTLYVKLTRERGAALTDPQEVDAGICLDARLLPPLATPSIDELRRHGFKVDNSFEFLKRDCFFVKVGIRLGTFLSVIHAPNERIFPDHPSDILWHASTRVGAAICAYELWPRSAGSRMSTEGVVTAYVDFTPYDWKPETPRDSDRLAVGFTWVPGPPGRDFMVEEKRAVKLGVLRLHLGLRYETLGRAAGKNDSYRSARMGRAELTVRFLDGSAANPNDDSMVDATLLTHFPRPRESACPPKDAADIPESKGSATGEKGSTK